MLIKHVGTEDVDCVVRPDIGETITVRHDYAPWLLGFCRWAVTRQARDGDVVFSEPLETGRWKWRGSNARYTETVVPDTPT